MTDVDQEELGEKCDYDPCHCVPETTSTVVDGKSVFCSKGCHDGRGCHHERCRCADE